ncbi:MAG TPA: alpha/beta hydrolase [Candidatus Dormibacteraeota bacterium]
MRRLRVAAALAVLFAGVSLSAAPVVPTAAAPAVAPVVRSEVAFTVTNPADPGHTSTVRGTLVRPAGCTSSVLLAEHGLSYGRWAWDFPLDPATYSMAQGLAQRGHAMLAIDELGYGASDHPNGYTLSVQAYAAITDQIVQQLRRGGYASPSGVAPAFTHVGLIGHSAGSEIVELAAGMFGDADALIVTGYEHTPTGVSQDWLAREWIPGDNTRAAQGDYEYFETDPQTRAADMYAAAAADPAVIARDNAMANLTPSAEIWSIGPQPSRAVIGAITAPLLVILAQNDVLFPPAGADTEMSLFAAAQDKTLSIVGGAGHVLTLHRSAPLTTAVVASWLENHEAVMPRC